MTQEEFESIPFSFAGHVSMENEHCLTKIADYKGHIFRICTHTPMRDGEPHGRTYTHFMIDNGRVFRSKEKFLEALKDL